MFSSTPDNVPFYESFGFEVIGQIKLGENNPKWKKEPVLVPLVSSVSNTTDDCSSFNVLSQMLRKSKANN